MGSKGRESSSLRWEWGWEVRLATSWTRWLW